MMVIVGVTNGNNNCCTWICDAPFWAQSFPVASIKAPPPHIIYRGWTAFRARTSRPPSLRSVLLLKNFPEVFHALCSTATLPESRHRRRREETSSRHFAVPSPWVYGFLSGPFRCFPGSASLCGHVWGAFHSGLVHEGPRVWSAIMCVDKMRGKLSAFRSFVDLFRRHGVLVRIFFSRAFQNSWNDFLILFFDTRFMKCGFTSTTIERTLFCISTTESKQFIYLK